MIVDWIPCSTLQGRSASFISWRIIGSSGITGINTTGIIPERYIWENPIRSTDTSGSIPEHILRRSYHRFLWLMRRRGEPCWYQRIAFLCYHIVNHIRCTWLSNHCLNWPIFLLAIKVPRCHQGAFYISLQISLSNARYVFIQHAIYICAMCII